MIRDFTEYVRSLGDGGEPPDMASYEAARKLLRGTLVREMSRRGLRNAPPSYLGIYGGSRWDEELLEDLVSEAYSFVFVRRCGSLLSHLLKHGNVDGTVLLSVRNFLNDAQQRNDRLGFRIFEMAAAAVATAVACGDLHVLEGPERIRNDTVLGGSPLSDPTALADIDLGPQVRRWNDELLPGLVTARGKAREEVECRLARYLAELATGEVEVFRFRDLMDPLKRDVRARWRAFWEALSGEVAFEEGIDGMAALVRLVPPDAGLEERQSFEQLLACVANKLDGLDEKPSTLDYLEKLWLFLSAFAAEAAAGELRLGRKGPEAAFSAGTSGGEKPPADLKLSRLLEVPRARIPGLKATLGRFVEECREAVSGKAAVIEIRGRVAGVGSLEASPGYAQAEGASIMDRDSRVEQLRLATGEAAARFLKQREELEDLRGEPPQQGDLFLVTASGEPSVEWLVVEHDSDAAGRWLVVVADDNPLVGSRDLAIDAAAAGGVTTLRCGVHASVEGRALERETRTGRVDEEVLDRVRERRREIAAGARRGALSERQVDDSMAYGDWIGKLEGILTDSPNRSATAVTPSADRAIHKHGDSVAKLPVPNRRRWRSMSSLLQLAASVLLVVSIGLAGGFFQNGIRLDEVERDRARLERERAELEATARRQRRDLENQQRLIEDLGEQKTRIEARLEELRNGQGTTRLSAPRAVPFVWLSSERPVRGSDDPLVLPAGAEALVLILEVAEPEPFPTYRLELLERDTRELLWSVDELVKRGSELSLEVPRAMLADGVYQLRVYGLSGAEKVLVEEYQVTLKWT